MSQSPFRDVDGLCDAVTAIQVVRRRVADGDDILRIDGFERLPDGGLLARLDLVVDLTSGPDVGVDARMARALAFLAQQTGADVEYELVFVPSDARRAALVEQARDSIAKGSKSFAVASKLFDPVTRERAWLLYAWCRRCDDLADGQDLGSAISVVDDPQARLGIIRDLSAYAMAGQATGDPAFDALGVVAGEVGLPQRWVNDLIAGFALDADGFAPRTADDLLRYCYHVAGVVGCMMAVVMGVDPADDATLDRACDLGLAFQLANIARDIGEDDAAGRCYLPADWLAELDIPPGETLRPAYRARLAVLGRRLGALAGAYEASARAGTPALPYRSAWAVLAAAGIYGDIAREVARRGERAWDARVFTTKADKLGWVAKAGVQALRRGRWAGAGGREGLWVRPGR